MDSGMTAKSILTEFVRDAVSRTRETFAAKTAHLPRSNVELSCVLEAVRRAKREAGELMISNRQ